VKKKEREKRVKKKEREQKERKERQKVGKAMLKPVCYKNL
jgi:hypothetical protein